MFLTLAIALVSFSVAALAGSSLARSMQTCAGKYYTIASANSKAYAIKNDGTLWEWDTGVVGPSTTPVQAFSDVVSVRVDNMMVYVLKKDGSVWARGTVLSSSVPGGPLEWPVFTKIMDGASTIIAEYDTNGLYAIKDDGTLVYWAYASLEFISGSWVATIVNKEIPILSDVRSVMPYFRTNKNMADYYDPWMSDVCYAIKNDGTLWTWTHDNLVGPGAVSQVTSNASQIIGCFWRVKNQP